MLKRKNIYMLILIVSKRIISKILEMQTFTCVHWLQVRKQEYEEPVVLIKRSTVTPLNN